MDTFTRAMLRVQGFPPTLTAFMMSIAVLFQSVMTSARTSVLLDIRARPTIAVFSTFIVASFSEIEFSDDYERFPSCCACLFRKTITQSKSLPERGSVRVRGPLIKRRL